MTTMTPQEILRAAAALVDQPGKWTQGQLAADASGADAEPNSDRAASFCALGAIYHVRGVDDESVDARYEGGGSHEAAKALRQSCSPLGRYDIAEWNDAPGRTAAEVASALRRAADSLDEHHDTCMCISCLPTPRDDEAET